MKFVLISISNVVEYHVHAFLSVPEEASWRVLSQNGLRRQCSGCTVYDTVKFHRLLLQASSVQDTVKGRPFIL